ncbi:MAG: glycerophosphodiester phosphodiesterase family protein [Candidatus Gracilibacteria bacterium]
METPSEKPTKSPPKRLEKPREFNETKTKRRNISGIIVDELIGIQKRISKIPSALKEILSPGAVKAFFEKVFGSGNKISSFLSLITSSLAEKFKFLNKVKISWGDFEDQLKIAAEKVTKLPFNLKEFIVSHRALGYGRHRENSKEAMIAAIRGGEKQIEIDLRRGVDGKIYLSHDPIHQIENPKNHFTELSEALRIFAEDENQDIVIFFDIKEEGIVEELDPAIETTDQKYKNRHEYIPIADRHFVMGFNFKILKTARKLRKNRPLIFCYIPVYKLKGLGRFIKKLGQEKMIEICKIIDKFSGGHLAKDLAKTCVAVNDEKISETNENGDSFLGIFTTLPPDEVLKIVDYACVPAILASKKLVKRIHEKGVNVAVWGVSERRIQNAIVEIGADLVITDKPDIE